MTDILVIFIKWPEPGMVKTRIGRVLGHDKAAKLYRYMVSRVIENLSPLLTKGMKICWYFDSISKTREVKNWIKNEMYALNINNLSNQIFCHQVGSDLGEKLQFVFNKYLSEGFDRVLAIGSDCITISDKIILEAFESIGRRNELVFGPCSDGGYYLVGMNDFRASLVFDGVPWSTDHVLETSLMIAQKNQLGVTLLEELNDLDSPQDLEKSCINLCDFEC